MIGKYSNPCFSEYITPSSDSTKMEIGSVLFSQLIRHEGVYVTGYADFMKRVFENPGEVWNCSATFPVSIRFVSEERLMQIMKVRTSWFAVTDRWDDPNSWSAILKKYITGNLSRDKKYLHYFGDRGQFDPSTISQYSIDDNLRLHKGYKAYLPDAFALESRDLVLERIRRFGDTPLLQDYLQMFDYGYVQDNPSNPLRRKWEEVNK